MLTYGIIVAAGKSERMGPNVDKAFLTLGSKPVLAFSLLAFEKCTDIDGVVLVVRKDRLEGARGLVRMFGCAKVKRIVAGGATRQASVLAGLAQVGDDVQVVAVHDGARPCITPDFVSEVVKSAKTHGSGVAAVKITDTIKQVDKGILVAHTVDRTKLWAVQTPQAFRVSILKKALEHATRKRQVVTDEACAVELIGEDVRLVPATIPNVKITTANDLIVAANLLRL